MGAYAPLPPISQADAESESEETRLFAPTITISATVQHRGRQFTVTSQGYTIDQFADMLDKKFGTAQTALAPATNGHAPMLSEPPLCPQHRKVMKPMKFADKQGHTFMCTAKVGDGWCEERA